MITKKYAKRMLMATDTLAYYPEVSGWKFVSIMQAPILSSSDRTSKKRLCAAVGRLIQAECRRVLAQKGVKK